VFSPSRRALGARATDDAIVVIGTGFAEIAEQLQNGFLAIASHSGDGADAIPFHYHCHYQSFCALEVEPITPA
jgi:hypothetical protein